MRKTETLAVDWACVLALASCSPRHICQLVFFFCVRTFADRLTGSCMWDGERHLSDLYTRLPQLHKEKQHFYNRWRTLGNVDCVYQIFVLKNLVCTCPGHMGPKIQSCITELLSPSTGSKIHHINIPDALNLILKGDTGNLIPPAQ